MNLKGFLQGTAGGANNCIRETIHVLVLKKDNRLIKSSTTDVTKDPVQAPIKDNFTHSAVTCFIAL